MKKNISLIACFAALLSFSGCSLLDSYFEVTLEEATPTSLTIKYMTDFSALSQIAETFATYDEDGDGMVNGQSIITRASMVTFDEPLDPDMDRMLNTYDNLVPDTEYIIETTARVGLRVFNCKNRFRTLPEAN